MDSVHSICELGQLGVSTAADDDGTIRYFFSGVIDERSDLRELIPEMSQHATVVIDLANVSSINSLGVRAWVRLLGDLAGHGVHVRLSKCAEVMVQQFNMIPETLQGAVVDSVQAPFECTACESEDVMVPIVLAAHADEIGRGALTPPPCPRCGSPLTFLDFVDRYFSFLVPAQ